MGAPRLRLRRCVRRLPLVELSSAPRRLLPILLRQTTPCKSDELVSGREIVGNRIVIRARMDGREFHFPFGG